MKVIVTKDYTASCRVAADMIIAQLKADPESKLGLATGGTVVPIYEMLAAAVKAGEVSFAKACSVNLDEYVGLDPAHPQSYRYFMDENLFNKVDIDKSRTFVASGVGDEEETLRVFKAKLEEGRPIDIQLLGIGVDGHIGFNEPSANLVAGAHAETLDESTIEANARFFASKEEVPTRAITMGVGDIMKAKSTVLVASGKSKAYAIKRLIMDDFVTGEIPASVLKMHPNATIVIDEELAAEVGYKA